MIWHWLLQDWPNFTRDAKKLEKAERIFARDSGILTGIHLHLSAKETPEMMATLMSEEATDTASIEGEILDRDSVKSSLQKRLGIKCENRKSSGAAEAGIAEMFADVYRDPEEALTHETLYRWHHMLMNGRRDIEDVGRYRRSAEPMQIVSGPDYARKVHYEALPSYRVPEEMEKFIRRFNDTAPTGKRPLPPIARAALIHLWFEAVHPFEDGNGRIGRALSEKALAQYRSGIKVTGIAGVILRRKKEYYAALEQTNTVLDITEWTLFFASVIIEATRRTCASVGFIIEKSKLMQRLEGELNLRQEKALLRMFREGIDGFQGGLSAANYHTITQAPPATITRDLADLVDKQALIKTGERKTTRYHLNINAAPVPTVRTEEIV